MTHVTFPKPSRRPRKPKKPLPRSKGFIKRGSRPARVSKSAARQAELAADSKWSRAIRRKGPCIAKGKPLFTELRWRIGSEEGLTIEISHQRCGATTAAHILSRRYSATRHVLENGVPLCFEAHDFFTRHPDQWVDFIAGYLGAEKYEALRRKAIAGPKGQS